MPALFIFVDALQQIQEFLRRRAKRQEAEGQRASRLRGISATL